MIIDRIANQLTQKLIDHNAVKFDDFDVYYYGIQLMIEIIINAIGLFLLALIFGYIKEAVVYLSFFILLRTYSGGYHAKTYLNCFVMTAVSTFSLIWLAHILVIYSTTLILIPILLIAVILVYLLAPVESENKPLSEKNKITLRKKSIGIVIAESILIISAYVMIEEAALYCIIAALGVLMVSISMTSKLFQKSFHSESNNYS